MYLMSGLDTSTDFYDRGGQVPSDVVFNKIRSEPSRRLFLYLMWMDMKVLMLVVTFFFCLFNYFNKS